MMQNLDSESNLESKVEMSSHLDSISAQLSKGLNLHVSVQNQIPVIDHADGVVPVIWDYENIPIRAHMSTAEAVSLITAALKKIDITSTLRFFIFVASPSPVRISPIHHKFFTKSGEFVYHKVYDREEDIVKDPKLGKKQIADKCIKECLTNLDKRMTQGEYRGRQMVFISGDKGFRPIIDSLRANEMSVVFIKPGRDGIYAPLTSKSSSVNIEKVFDQDPIWHCVIMTQTEEKKARKAEKRHKSLQLIRGLGESM